MLIHLIINTLIVGSGYAMVAMAFRLMNSVSPFFNMTIGSIAVFGGYMAFFLLNAGVPFYLMIILAVLATALFSGLLEVGIYTPMRNHGASSMVLMVCSLGVYTIFESVVHLIFGSQYQTLGNMESAKMVNIGVSEIPLVQVLMVIICFIVWGLLNYFLHHTFMGKKIRAVNDSSTLADIIGLKNNQIIFLVSVLTGVVLGIDGLLVGYDTGLEPTMGFNLLFKGMIGAIIGGIATLNGAFFGAMFLAFTENVGVALFASEWRDLISFVIFICFLSLRPQGIFQKKDMN